MLFYALCNECLALRLERLPGGLGRSVGAVGIAPGDEPGDGAIWAEMSDEGFVEGTCSKGHVSRMVVQGLRFELLFDFAALAFLDGYNREAISTAAVALERFYEFYIAAAGAERRLSREAFAAFWPGVSNQSERQLGAAMLMHALNGGSVKQFPDGAWTKMRNKVTHKGYYPTKSEAHGFLDTTRARIIDLGRTLRSTCPQGIRDAYTWALVAAHDGARTSGGPASGLSMERVISWNVRDEKFGALTLDEEIEFLRLRRAQYWKAG